MSHISPRDIETMSSEQLHRTLDDLKDELLQLRAQQALGGSSSNSGSYKQTRRSIARILTKINQNSKGVSRYLGYAIHVVCHRKFASAKKLPRSNRKR